jgi:hypothetical protein
MKQIIPIIFTLAFFSVLTPKPSHAVAPYIIGPDMRIVDNDIIVDLSIDNIKELESTIKSGVAKEIVFTVELIRSWRFWPDEFVVSKIIKKNIVYDNLRSVYHVSSFDGILRDAKKLKDYREVKDWIFTVNNINLANIKELEPSSYYIRVVVESKGMEQIPLIGFLIHFIPEVEMSLAKESKQFRVKDN